MSQAASGYLVTRGGKARDSPPILHWEPGNKYIGTDLVVQHAVSAILMVEVLLTQSGLKPGIVYLSMAQDSVSLRVSMLFGPNFQNLRN